MSFEVLRQVNEHNRDAAERERERVMAMGAVTPNSPMQPMVEAWGVPLDTLIGPHRSR